MLASVNSRENMPASPRPKEPDGGATPDAPRLPHERDTHREIPPAPSPRMQQAQDDLASGKQDTDCRNRAAQVIEQKQRRRG